MKLALHIFRKDIRQHWIVILSSLGIQIANVLYEQRKWLPTFVQGFGFGARILMLLPALLMFGWLAIIVRVVQSESPSSKRQYWITRPIEWKSLLAAKLLFAIAFIELPLLLANAYLLIKSDIPPSFRIIGDVLEGHLGLMIFLVVPLIALMSVTEGFGQAALAVLGVIAALAGMVALSIYRPTECYCSVPEAIQGGILFGVSLIVIVVQYAWRRTGQSRAALALAAVAIALVLAFSPYRALIDQRYPPLNPTLNSTESLGPFALSGNGAPLVTHSNEFASIQVPVDVSGIPQDAFVKVKGYMLELETRNGLRWSSEWHFGKLLFPDEKRFDANFEVDKTFFDKVRTTPVTGRVFLVLSLWRDANPVTVRAAHDPVPVPGAGLCGLRSGLYLSGVKCRFAVQSPELLILKVNRSESTCPTPKDYPDYPALREGIARTASEQSDSGPFSPIDTIDMSGLNLNAPDDTEEFGDARLKLIPAVCPGTPLHFSRPRLERKFGMQIDLKEFRLLDEKIALGSFVAIPRRF
jgi:hypothetical protein